MKRFWEIDALRGLAVFAMILYHLLVDLKLFYYIDIPVFSGTLLVFARLVALTFIFLVGTSASFQQKRRPLSTHIKRSLIILFWAFIITIATYLLFPSEFIFFGILHLIGTSLLLLIPFLFIKSNLLITLIGFFIISIGIVAPSTPSRASLDYFPLFPWFGIVLIGLVFGRLYPAWRSKFILNEPEMKFAKILKFTGRNSLPFYLLHQPILIGTLFAIYRILNL
ncbi:DUF1624 domain-containing protein [Candidatus Curtissbacteria bacterium]|nr:DUF1624 domain-containing protein [Candidatus Curtissbacteria bacterium]